MDFSFPGDRNEMRKAILELQEAANGVSGQINLLLAFVTQTPEKNEEWRSFVNTVAHTELPAENHEMQRMARLLVSLMESTPTDDNNTPSPGGQSSISRSSHYQGANVIQFPTFPSKK